MCSFFYPSIFIDSFLIKYEVRKNYFFLTHTHTDHMRTLTFKFLQKNPHLFLSEISLEVLCFKYSSYRRLSNVHVLKENHWNVIDENKEVYVLNANHYPGSVFLIFLLKGKYYVYTGDFRLTKELKEKLKNLELISPIENLFFDGTFQRVNIPSYEDSKKFLFSQFEKSKSQIRLYNRNIPVLLVQDFCKEKNKKIYCSFGRLRLFFLPFLVENENEADIVVTDSKNDWIISSLIFHCLTKQNLNKLKKIDNRMYISYHPGKEEINFLLELWKPKNVQSCYEDRSVSKKC